jgi:hypothetical protein
MDANRPRMRACGWSIRQMGPPLMFAVEQS